jgi:protoporphyrinogen oxidase
MKRGQQNDLLKVDCVIIGAGAAGLQTASSLLLATTNDDNDNNHRPSFVIVEARDRIGGRIHTTHHTNPITGSKYVRDLGAAWVHGIGGIEYEKKNPMVQLLEEYSQNNNNNTSISSILKPIFDGNPWTRPNKILHQPKKIVLFVNGTKIDNENNSPVVSKALEQHSKLLQDISQYGNSLFETGNEIETTKLSVEQVIQESILPKRKEHTDDDDGEDEQQQQLVLLLTPFYLFLIENWNGISMNETQLCLVVESSEEEMTNRTNTQNMDEEHCEGDGDFAGPHCKVTTGMTTVLQPLIEHVGLDNIRLKEKIIKITDKKSYVEIVSSSGLIIEAKCCVSTIPLGVLQYCADDLFRPSLSPEKMEAIHSIWSGSYKKVFLTFDHSFWPNDTPFIGLIRTRKNNTEDEQDLTSRNMMIPSDYLLLNNLWAKDGIPSIEAILCGDIGKWAFQKTDEVIKQAVIEFIESSMSLSNLKDYCLDCHVTRWEEDEFTRGSYSTYKLGTMDRHVDELRTAEWDCRLVFAGEPTEIEDMGSFHAALMSGQRVAREVLEYLDTIYCKNENYFE